MSSTESSLYSFAKHLGFLEVSDLLEESLKEEESADKKLGKIADGSFFSMGINEEAAAVSAAIRDNKQIAAELDDCYRGL